MALHESYIKVAWPKLSAMTAMITEKSNRSLIVSTTDGNPLAFIPSTKITARFSKRDCSNNPL